MASGIAKLFGGGDIKAQQITDPFANIRIPTIEEQQIILQSPDLMGQYTPEQIQVMQEMTQSAMEGVKASPESILAQAEALKGIGEIARGGLTEADKSAARQMEREVSQQNEARRKAILNAMASRGTLGSGMELAAQLQNQQQAAEQASQAGENLIQQAQARSLAALSQQGSLAGQMRGQEFGEQSDIAKARDAIAQFNAQNRQRIAEANVGNRNQAQQYNLQQRQDLERIRAEMANQSQIHNKALYQTQFGNEMAKAGGQFNVIKAQAAADQAAEEARAAQRGAIMSGIGTIAGAGIGGMTGGWAGAKAGANLGGQIGGAFSAPQKKGTINNE